MKASISKKLLRSSPTCRLLILILDKNKFSNLITHCFPLYANTLPLLDCTLRFFWFYHLLGLECLLPHSYLLKNHTN